MQIPTRQLPAGQRHRLKKPVYALEIPTVPGLFIRIAGAYPRLRKLPQATLAPATPKGLAWLAERAGAALQGQVYEVVRLQP